jgi:2-dehydro-3-deoxyphosphogluconate aldolase / (4S)-4-hydroxy-2-oxoglutarate aldolase
VVPEHQGAHGEVAPDVRADVAEYGRAGVHCDAMTPQEFVAAFGEVRASAILRTARTADARAGMEAAVRGGFRICEFTLTVPGALDLIREFAAGPDLIVGAGTVLTADEARAAVRAGAQFLVSPVVDEAVISEAIRLGVAMMPGCATPTEMLRAHRAGAPLQKLFPAAATGPAWIGQTLAPLPFLRIVPTAGVTLDNAAAYLRAGAFAVGFVNTLFDPGDISAGRFDAIEDRARAMLAAVREARSS